MCNGFVRGFDHMTESNCNFVRGGIGEPRNSLVDSNFLEAKVGDADVIIIAFAFHLLTTGLLERVCLLVTRDSKKLQQHPTIDEVRLNYGIKPKWPVFIEVKAFTYP